MLELARLGVATRPGYAPATASPRIEVFELEPHPVSSSEIRERRAAPASRSTASSPPRSPRTSPSTGSTATVDVRRFAATLRALSSLEQARRIAALASEKLAEDVVILDMRPVCVYTDFFVLATGRNPRQTKAIFDEVHGQLKQESKLLPRAVDGPAGGGVDHRRLPRRRPARLHARDAGSSTGSRSSGATSPPSTSKPRRPSYNRSRPRGHSSAGRASGWQPEGRRFEPGWLHQSARQDLRRASGRGSPTTIVPRTQGPSLSWDADVGNSTQPGRLAGESRLAPSICDGQKSAGQISAR